MKASFVDFLRKRKRFNSWPIMHQNWHDLLFLHWALPPELVRPSLPKGIWLDTYDDKAWMAIVPFWMSKVRPHGLPAVPGLSHFSEMNLRTYVVDAQGRSGVWFFSLECDNPLAVWVARHVFHLNYQRASLSCQFAVDGTITYHWKREYSRANQTSLQSQFIYRGRGGARQAAPDTLEYFLLERYRLFCVGTKGLYTGEISHAPYSYQDVSLSAYDDSLFEVNGFTRPKRPPDHVCYAQQQRVDIFPLRKCSCETELN